MLRRPTVARQEATGAPCVRRRGRDRRKWNRTIHGAIAQVRSRRSQTAHADRPRFPQARARRIEDGPRELEPARAGLRRSVRTAHADQPGRHDQRARAARARRLRLGQEHGARGRQGDSRLQSRPQPDGGRHDAAHPHSGAERAAAQGDGEDRAQVLGGCARRRAPRAPRRHRRPQEAPQGARDQRGRRDRSRRPRCRRRPIWRSRRSTRRWRRRKRRSCRFRPKRR